MGKCVKETFGKSFKRFSSIIGRLSLDDSVNISREKGRDKQEKLFVPTVFSKELPDLMVLEYSCTGGCGWKTILQLPCWCGSD